MLTNVDIGTAPSRPGGALLAHEHGVSLLTIVKVGRWAEPSVGQEGGAMAECYPGANVEAIATGKEA